MRGRVADELTARELSGITPAYAGKRAGSSPSRSYVWDHPRVCGEEPTKSVISQPVQGSPPRMRGRAGNMYPGAVFFGITPAYAGKRPSPHACRAWFWDHPRVCGEELVLTADPKAVGGSPPRMRGREFATSKGRVAVGITPAYAGKSWQRPHRPQRWRDHPRVCGEEPKWARFLSWVRGSPPRMRGRVSFMAVIIRRRRITPAYAGKSDCEARRFRLSGDHPRVCGEEELLGDAERGRLGSPPRMRGRA